MREREPERSNRPKCVSCGEVLLPSMIRGEGFCENGKCPLFYKEQPFAVPVERADDGQEPASVGTTAEEKP